MNDLDVSRQVVVEREGLVTLDALKWSLIFMNCTFVSFDPVFSGESFVTNVTVERRPLLLFVHKVDVIQHALFVREVFVTLVTLKRPLLLMNRTYVSLNPDPFCEGFVTDVAFKCWRCLGVEFGHIYLGKVTIKI